MTHRILLVAMLLHSHAPGASAQAVDVTLREDSTRTPISGAIVRLLRDNAPVAQGLTSEAGRVTLRATSPGTFRIKVDRIGFGGMIGEPFVLTAGEMRRETIALRSVRIMLPTIMVRTERTCHTRMEEGVPAAALWEEIHKALTANVITQRELQLPLHVREFQRELNAERQVLREWTTSSRMVRGSPFGSLSPDTLAEFGFITKLGGEVTFAAPDAALLLSDEFVGTHCFRAVRGSGSQVGLAFEPVRSRRVSDVQGTLWLDRATGELRYLEYSYTNLPMEFQHPDVGGRVEFRRLPNGAFIVSDWYIRMPKSKMRFTPRLTFVLVGYLDQGGRVEIGSGTSRAEGWAQLRGTIFDSTIGTGLPGAVVRVRGWTDSTMTDENGRFELAVLATGPHVVVASHTKLGLMSDESSRPATLSLGQTTTVDFAVPPVEAFARQLCRKTGRSGLVGITLGPDRTPREGLDVRIRWQDASRAREERRQSGPRGIFAFCDLPPGRLLPVRLMHGIRDLSERNVRLAEGEFRWVELEP